MPPGVLETGSAGSGLSGSGRLNGPVRFTPRRPMSPGGMEKKKTAGRRHEAGDNRIHAFPVSATRDRDPASRPGAAGRPCCSADPGAHEGQGSLGRHAADAGSRATLPRRSANATARWRRVSSDHQTMAARISRLRVVLIGPPRFSTGASVGDAVENSRGPAAFAIRIIAARIK